MIYVLFFFLIIITCFEYYRHKDLVSPIMLMFYGWVLSVGLSLLKYNEWGDISFFTFLIIIFGILSFVIGSKFACLLKVKKEKQVVNAYIINKCFLWFSLLFMVITVILDFNFIYKLAFSAGFSGGTNFLTFARYSLVGEEKTPYYVYIPIVISQAIVFCLSHCLIHNFAVKSKTKSKFLFFGCIFLYLVLCFLSTGRTMIMYYVIFLVCDFGVSFYKYRRGRKKINHSILKTGIVGIIFIAAVFMLVQVFFRSSKYGIEWSLFDEIIKYTSSSIYAFNKYLEFPYYAAEGEYETLYNLHSILNRLGFSFEIKDISLPFTVYSGVMTNIYTALRRYIHDYGFMGMVIIQIIVGFIYSRLYLIIRNNENIVLEVLFFASVYALPFIAIEERFLVNVLSIRTILTLIFIYLINLLIKKQRVNKTNLLERGNENERNNTCGWIGNKAVSINNGNI